MQHRNRIGSLGGCLIIARPVAVGVRTVVLGAAADRMQPAKVEQIEGRTISSASP